MLFWDATDGMGFANDVLRAPGLHVCDLRPGRRPARLSVDEHTQVALRYRDRLRGDRLPSRDYNGDRYPDIGTLADLTPPGAPPGAVEGYTPWRWEVSVTPAGTPRARWVCERVDASAGSADA